MNQTAELIERICQSHRGVLSPDQRGLLQQEARRALRPKTLVAFGGHFKSGKSTLLNAALKRNILPVDDLPETGAICRIGPGARDALTIQTRAGEEFDVPCTTEAIRSYCSIVSGRGTRRQEVAAVQSLEIRLQGVPMPDTVRWLDTPGINEDREMDLRAAQAAGASDTLVWILTSRQPLSEPEEDFLANHIETQGPWSVVFILNSFLRSQTQEAWEAFCGRNLPTIHSKLRYFLEGTLDDPRLVPVCARDVANRPGRGFGSRHLECIVRELSIPENQNVLNTRLFRVARAAQTVLQQLSEALKEAQEQDASATSAAAEMAARDSKRWERSVNSAIEEYLQGLEPAISRGTDKVCGAIDEGVACGSAHCNQLNLELAQELGDLARQFKSRLREAKGGLRHGTVDLAATETLRDIPTVQFEVEDVPHQQPSNCTRAGGLIGIHFGPLGALVGCLLGAGADYLAGASDRNDRKISGAKAAVRAAAEQVHATLRQRCAELQSQLLCTIPTHPPVRRKEQQRTEELRRAIHDLEELRTHATGRISQQGTAQVILDKCARET